MDQKPKRLENCRINYADYFVQVNYQQNQQKMQIKNNLKFLFECYSKI